MERIGPADRSSSFSARRKRDTQAADDPGEASFSRLVDESRNVRGTDTGNTTDSEGEAPDRSLSELLDTIFAVGERVKKEPDQRNVIRYKEAVQQLVKMVLDRGIAIEEQTSSPNILRQKRFTLVKVIDQKLDRLVSGVLLGQKDTLDVLGRIDEINGLVIDLTS